MKDRDFLMWIHARLTDVHHENPLVDYMHKLRAIIVAYPKNKVTPNTAVVNNLKQLKELLNVN